MTRVAQYPIEPQFTKRWSPRAMSGESLPKAELFRLFEAARWAPSSGNNQPWRFIYAHRDTPAFQKFFDFLDKGNQVWCHRAAVLVVVVSKKTRDNGKPALTHSFDTGAAWMSIALQGHHMGLVVHGMQGFDYDRARAELGIPDDHAVECMIAIGHPGKKEDLPPEKQEMEKPNDRRPVEKSVFEGTFTAAT
jgi:nitroreductase